MTASADFLNIEKKKYDKFRKRAISRYTNAIKYTLSVISGVTTGVGLYTVLSSSLGKFIKGIIGDAQNSSNKQELSNAMVTGDPNTSVAIVNGMTTADPNMTATVVNNMATGDPNATATIIATIATLIISAIFTFIIQAVILEFWEKFFTNKAHESSTLKAAILLVAVAGLFTSTVLASGSWRAITNPEGVLEVHNKEATATIRRIEDMSYKTTTTLQRLSEKASAKAQQEEAQGNACLDQQTSLVCGRRCKMLKALSAESQSWKKKINSDIQKIKAALIKLKQYGYTTQNIKDMNDAIKAVIFGGNIIEAYSWASPKKDQFEGKQQFIFNGRTFSCRIPTLAELFGNASNTLKELQDTLRKATFETPGTLFDKAVAQTITMSFDALVNHDFKRLPNEFYYAALIDVLIVLFVFITAKLLFGPDYEDWRRLQLWREADKYIISGLKKRYLVVPIPSESQDDTHYHRAKLIASVLKLRKPVELENNVNLHDIIPCPSQTHELFDQYTSFQLYELGEREYGILRNMQMQLHRGDGIAEQAMSYSKSKQQAEEVT